MDTYEDVRAWLYKQLPMYQRQGASAYKPGLEKMQAFMAYLGNPHQAFSSIHVAGTNGKGSTAHMITSVLMEAGYTVGLYTSPHLKDFSERIRINGIAIETTFVVSFVQEHKDYFLKAQLSFFELTVGMSFAYFKEQQIDFAIVEVGLGGRLDATNIISPVLAVITNIGFDHTQFLGDTLEAIAGEKAGIIKKNIPIVIGETQEQTTAVFKATASNLMAPIIWADAVEVKPFPTDLTGLYQKKNIQTTVVALQTLNLDQLNEAHIRLGLQKVVSNTHLQGRWQILDNNPLVVADVTHNAAGFAYVIEQIKQTPYDKLHLVLGFVQDKDLELIFSQLPRDASYYFCAPNMGRAEEVSVLMKLAEKYTLIAEVFNSVDLAYKSAAKNADNSDFIYVGGSTFVVAEIL
ncbi:bifunctional folylpolyglutamate synthase/dihydrofolate synthase [Flavobacteriaceae bacterium]|nr:bifunctional folylpolyglutamate synthase/dihydrofolate synthase [Flavobacteriaceae bacterium]MDB9987886.1 bifunctional folylpolyglutamate synthase/dihydrofolate synthase [Flavobacteriaceae bacterium]MDC1439364.1 bifunctional folylpolyglutamate synthase/dihydrofolate synthase [Flavobacteriaceae bacterium]